MNDLNAQINVILGNVNANNANMLDLNALRYQQMQRYMLFQRFFRPRTIRVPAGFNDPTPELELLLQHLYEKDFKTAKFNEIELEKKIFDSLEIINH